MPSRYYNNLRKNITLLESEFYKFSKRLDGNYTNSELLQCRAFITFCHAEIEHYLEDIALNVVNKAEKKWINDALVSNSIAAMIAYRISRESSLPDSPTQQAPDNRFESLIRKAIVVQKAFIKKNNGIKGKNLSNLFIPIGLTKNRIEEALVIQLDNFGRARGDQVHSSSPISLQRLRDPFDDERKDVRDLLSELETFDDVIKTLR